MRRFLYCGAADEPARVIRSGVALTTKAVSFTQDSGIASSGNGSQLNDTSKSWIPGEHIGRTLVIDSGTGAGQVRTITANTGTQLSFVALDGAAVISATSEYRIITLSASDVLLLVEPWPFYPDGEDGLSVFRAVIVKVHSSSGYRVRVTPIVDDVALVPQEFSSSSSGFDTLTAWITGRGSSISCIVEQLEAIGTFEIVNVLYDYVTLRPNRAE